MCTTGGKKSFKMRLEVGDRSGMKIGGRKKEILWKEGKELVVGNG